MKHNNQYLLLPFFSLIIFWLIPASHVQSGNLPGFVHSIPEAAGLLAHQDWHTRKRGRYDLQDTRFFQKDIFRFFRVSGFYPESGQAWFDDILNRALKGENESSEVSEDTRIEYRTHAEAHVKPIPPLKSRSELLEQQIISTLEKNDQPEDVRLKRLDVSLTVTPAPTSPAGYSSTSTAIKPRQAPTSKSTDENSESSQSTTNDSNESQEVSTSSQYTGQITTNLPATEAKNITAAVKPDPLIGLIKNGQGDKAIMDILARRKTGSVSVKSRKCRKNSRWCPYPQKTWIRNASGRLESRDSTAIANRARKTAVSDANQCLMPEFKTLIENIEKDLQFHMSSLPNKHFVQAVSGLAHQIKRIKAEGYPYKDSVLAAFYYSSIKALLYQRLYPDILKRDNVKYKVPEKAIYHLAQQLYSAFPEENPSVYIYFSTSNSEEIDGISGLLLLLENPDLVVYPEFDALDKEFFVTISPFPFFPLGVINSIWVEADRNHYLPVAFFSHDISHSLQYVEKNRYDYDAILASIETRDLLVTAKSKHPWNWLENYINMLFRETHETGETPCHLLERKGYFLFRSHFENNRDHNSIAGANLRLWRLRLVEYWQSQRPPSFNEMSEESKQEIIRSIVDNFSTTCDYLKEWTGAELNELPSEYWHPE